MKKHILISTLAVVAVTTFALASARPAVAMGWGDQSSVSSLVQMIAEKFGLKATDVQAVFDTHRADRQKEMHQKYTDRLTQLVKDGKLTEAQKTFILTKHAEMQKQHEADMTSMKDKTPDEHRALRETRRTELEAWAKKNNIDIQYLMPLGKGGMRGHGMMRGPGIDR